MRNPNWQLIKERNITEGSVWHDPETDTFIRHGDDKIQQEGLYQQRLYELGFPVPEVLEHGSDDDGFFFVERSLGQQSLHDRAVAEFQTDGSVSAGTIAAATAVSFRFLERQLQHAVAPTPQLIADWFEHASHLQRNIRQHPEIDTSAARQAIQTMSARLMNIPMSYGHQDYGLPNLFVDGIIDWQFYARSPIGFDAYTMLDAPAFMGGTRGYDYTPAQRQAYLTELDAFMVNHGGPALSEYRGDFLLAKGFFFIATVRQGGPVQVMRSAYRRELCRLIIEQYNAGGVVDTSNFPTMADYETRQREQSAAV